MPFTADSFHELFRIYNAQVWPAVILAYFAAAAIVAGLFVKRSAGTRILLALLALMWLWTGLIYHGVYFSRINPAAVAFAALFVLQGGLLLLAAWRHPPARRSPRNASAITSIGFIVFALIVYPVLGLLSGSSADELPMLGITPCPLTIFTIGCLLQLETRELWWLWPLPLVWTLIGGSAAILLNVPPDWALLVAGPLSLLSLAWPSFARPRVPVPSFPAQPKHQRVAAAGLRRSRSYHTREESTRA